MLLINTLFINTSYADTYGIVFAKKAVRAFTPVIGRTNSANVDVYNGHNLYISSKKATIAKAGTIVNVIGTETGALGLSEWYQISYESSEGEAIEGYVETKYIDSLPETKEVENDFFIGTAYMEEALPDGTTMVGGETNLSPEEEERLRVSVKETLGKGHKITGIQFFDVGFENNGEVVETAATVALRLNTPMKVEEGEDLSLVHFKNDEIEVVENATFTRDGGGRVEGLSFTVDSFSTFAVVRSITVNYIDSKGNNYEITVYYTDEAGILPGSRLEVTELQNPDYDNYKSQAVKALGSNEEYVAYAALFDIDIVKNGTKVPLQDTVDVSIRLLDKAEGGNTNVVHFGGTTEILDNEVTGDTVSFETSGFSIYAVIVILKDEDTFVVEDEDYRVTVSYTKEAHIPLGTKLIVKEITPEENQYWELRKNTIEKINEGVKWEDTEMTPDPRKGITDVVFFDISLLNAGTEIEPDIPIQVKIEYKNNLGILVPEEEKTEIIHFAKDGIEIIDEADIRYSEEQGNRIAVSYEYEQSSFSTVGSYSTGEYIDINESNIIHPSAGILASPILGASGDSSITASKTINDDDHDGVYDLTLSVTGQSESSSSTSVNKSNVVIVVDVSGSMSRSVYSKYTGTSTSGTYYGLVNGNYLELDYSGGQWYYYARDRWRTYSGDRYIKETRLDATRSALKELANALLANNSDEVLDGVSLNDIIEISLVKFAYANEDNWNQYNGTSTLIRDVNTATEQASLNTIIDNLYEGGGTNWERALAVAKAEADRYKAAQPDEPVSVIFMTDGVPTSWGTTNVYGQEERDITHYAWNEAKDEARAIVNDDYILYDIFAFGTDAQKYDRDDGRTDADYLRALTNYAYTGSGTYAETTLNTDLAPYFYNAKDTTALQNAFTAIIKRINGEVGYGGVTVDDGVTVGITNTSLTVDGTINTNNIRYTIKNGNVPAVTVKIDGNTAIFTSATTGETTTVNGVSTTVNIDGTDHTNTLFTATIDEVEYKITPATMDANGKVVWELAPVGIIENGITYELTFDVWPRQLAYDIVADLNNEVKTLDQIRADVIASQGEDVWNQIYEALVKPGDSYVNEAGETVTATAYTVRTNYEQYVDYYTVDTTQVDGQDPVTTYTAQPRKELGPKDPVNLARSKMKLIKKWDDSLDQSQLNEILWKNYATDENGKVIDQSADNSREYSVKFHIWKADTLNDLNTQISNYAEAVGGSYAQADAHDYIDKTVGWNGSDYDWEESLDVAPGHMIEISKARSMGIDLNKHTQVTYGGKTYLVLETGHYYTVTEENIDRHFELNTIIYHPMLVDGVLSNVTFKSDGTVEDIVPLSGVEATNTLKGGINVLKKVFDDKGNEVLISDDTFTVIITMKNADGTPYENWDYRIYYGINNPDGSWNEEEQTYGRSGHITGTTGNGGVITAELYAGDVIRIINVPSGVAYSVVESSYDNTIYELASQYTFSLNTGGINQNTGEENIRRFTTNATGISYMISVGENDNFVPDNEMSVRGNSCSQAVVVNKTPTVKINIKKIADSNASKVLEGVRFKLYYDEELTKQVIMDAFGNDICKKKENYTYYNDEDKTTVSETETEYYDKTIEYYLISDSNGKIDLGTLAGGVYYLVETKTLDGYILNSDPILISIIKPGVVSYNQTDYAKSSLYNSNSEETLLIEPNGGLYINYDGENIAGYTITVDNKSGAELPATGGITTKPIYLLGTLLTALAAITLFLRRTNQL